MATDYAPDKIRNVVLLGHSHDGKTMLAEAMLFASGGIARMGSPDSATATTDFEPEEHRRKISITLGVAFAEKGMKVLLVDLDPQGNLTMSQGLNPDSIERFLKQTVDYSSTAEEADSGLLALVADAFAEPPPVDGEPGDGALPALASGPSAIPPLHLSV